uniref:Uncharacterized protein n=3 Tax=Pectinophora gossypiella TaxID=13191 RepID=A0A1E1W4M2_PECGO
MFLKSQAAFLRTMKHNEEFDYTKVDRILHKMSEITGLKIKDLKKESDKFSVIKHFLDEKYKDSWVDDRGIKAIESAYEMQELIRNISKHAASASDFVIQPDLVKVSDAKYKKEIGPMPVFNDANRGPKTDSIKPGVMDKIDEETYEYEVRMPL